MKYFSPITIVSLTMCLMSTQIIARLSIKDSLQKAYRWVLPKKYQQEIIQKQFPISANGTIDIKNLNGSITIQTEWNQNNIFVKAIKQAPKKEQLADIGMLINQTPDTSTISIRTTQTDPKTAASISYIVSVPAHVAIHASTQVGDITIAHINGTIETMTEHGNITINNAGNTIIAHSKQAGSIKINQAKGIIQSSTHKGTINIYNAYNSIIANSDSGNIDVISSQVPEKGCIKLSTISGDIKLQMPESPNADISAHTQKGYVLCSYPITLKPREIILDHKNSWKQMRNKIDAILGNGTTQIVLQSHQSNIKISKTAVS